MAKISVIGLGYMGLPMAAVLAKAGYQVVGVDINTHIVESINKGVPHFDENGLNELVANVVSSGSLKAVTEPEPADIFVIAVPTPLVEEIKEPNMAYVEAAAASIALVLKENDLVLLESTSPVGATRNSVKGVIENIRPDLIDKVFYAFCPERAIPGETLKELINNDRSIGGLTHEATEKAIEFYASFVKGMLTATTAEIAEMVKLVENSSRDAQIAFANELSNVCDHLNINVHEVIQLANKHPRVNILNPGSGVGGHCIAVDPWFLIYAAKARTPFMQAARFVNDAKPFDVVSKIKKAITHYNGTPTVALMGLAYKPDVDDLRGSPSITILKEIQKENVNLYVCEPYLKTFEGAILLSMVEAVKKADILVMLTGHSVFKSLSAEQLTDKIIIDACGVFV